MSRKSKSLRINSEPGFSIVAMQGIPLPLESAIIHEIYESLIAHGIPASFGHLLSRPFRDRSSVSFVVSDTNLLAAKELLSPWAESLSAQAVTVSSNLTCLSIEDPQANNLITLANSVTNILNQRGIELFSLTATGRSILCLVENKETEQLLEALSNI